ncbi:MAG TPA: DUF305 domain-containing protein [Actinophytocola sp.]|uniref:DUF305 domain-containing protein n=1 Tax=Actinophytocola sp. TaxID=1872138 RepID=UPI002DDD50C2|nr:DUF305 domain-containing protein [Actinophytocola sp.]HEV2779220.1 DUF305 domain-containing protein [Actinophytocola sp.]
MAAMRTVCALAAALALSGLPACTQEPSADGPPVLVPGRPGESAGTLAPGQPNPLPANRPNDADIRYVQDMIVHHQQAIVMSRLAPERAARDDVRRLADRIAGTQRPEIDMMNSWLRGHGRPTVDPEHAEHGSHAMVGLATPAQLEALRAARGPEFDRLYLQLMITHHEGALTMARAVQTAGMDVRVQEMADDVVATQSDEINTMRGLLG